jgi:hypothetical protein
VVIRKDVDANQDFANIKGENIPTLCFSKRIVGKQVE